jgi:hypothetical protein
MQYMDGEDLQALAKESGDLLAELMRITQEHYDSLKEPGAEES